MIWRKLCTDTKDAGLQMALDWTQAFFVKINADFERSAECVGQTHGVERSDNNSLLLLPKEDQS